MDNVLDRAVNFDTQAENAVENVKDLRAKINELLRIDSSNSELVAASHILAGHEKTLKVHTLEDKPQTAGTDAWGEPLPPEAGGDPFFISQKRADAFAPEQHDGRITD